MLFAILYHRCMVCHCLCTEENINAKLLCLPFPICPQTYSLVWGCPLGDSYVILPQYQGQLHLSPQGSAQHPTLVHLAELICPRRCMHIWTSRSTDFLFLNWRATGGELRSSEENNNSITWKGWDSNHVRKAFQRLQVTRCPVNKWIWTADY